MSKTSILITSLLFSQDTSIDTQIQPQVTENTKYLYFSFL